MNHAPRKNETRRMNVTASISVISTKRQRDRTESQDCKVLLPRDAARSSRGAVYRRKASAFARARSAKPFRQRRSPADPASPRLRRPGASAKRESPSRCGVAQFHLREAIELHASDFALSDHSS